MRLHVGSWKCWRYLCFTVWEANFEVTTRELAPHVREEVPSLISRPRLRGVQMKESFFGPMQQSSFDRKWGTDVRNLGHPCRRRGPHLRIAIPHPASDSTSREENYTVRRISKLTRYKVFLKRERWENRRCTCNNSRFVTRSTSHFVFLSCYHS